MSKHSFHQFPLKIICIRILISSIYIQNVYSQTLISIHFYLKGSWPFCPCEWTKWLRMTFPNSGSLKCVVTSLDCLVTILTSNIKMLSLNPPIPNCGEKKKKKSPKKCQVSFWFWFWFWFLINVVWYTLRSSLVQMPYFFFFFVLYLVQKK